MADKGKVKFKKFFITSRKGKERIIDVEKKLITGPSGPPKITPPPMIVGKAINMPKIAPPPMIGKVINMPEISKLVDGWCNQYNIKNKNFICNLIKNYANIDIGKINADTHMEDKDKREFNFKYLTLYAEFMKRYMVFLKFKNEVAQQFRDTEAYSTVCPYITNEQIKNFINFDKSLHEVMESHNDLTTHFTDIERIADKPNNSYIYKLYRMLYNEILINQEPFYKYMVKLLTIYKKAFNDLNDDITAAKRSLEDEFEIFEEIIKQYNKNKKYEISISQRNLILNRYMKITEQSNNKQSFKFNLKISKNEINIINHVLSYKTLCENAIDAIEDITLLIKDAELEIDVYNGLIIDFQNDYKDKIKNMKESDKKILIQFKINIEKFYEDESARSEGSTRSSRSSRSSKSTASETYVRPSTGRTGPSGFLQGSSIGATSAAGERAVPVSPKKQPLTRIIRSNSLVSSASSASSASATSSNLPEIMLDRGGNQIEKKPDENAFDFLLRKFM